MTSGNTPVGNNGTLKDCNFYLDRLHTRVTLKNATKDVETSIPCFIWYYKAIGLPGTLAAGLENYSMPTGPKPNGRRYGNQ